MGEQDYHQACLEQDLSHMAFERPTQVRFVSGMDGVYARPAVARQAGLGCRFAVIQDSHVEGQDDMVFDEALWRALVDFASRLGDRVEVMTQTGRRSRP
jgi:membrane protein implicated in regulation of membrane protease activity